MREINDELNFSGYTRNNVKSGGNHIADLTGKIELASGMAEEGLLEVETYKNYVNRQKKEIKDTLSQIYSQLKLEDTVGNFDFVFKNER